MILNINLLHCCLIIIIYNIIITSINKLGREEERSEREEELEGLQRMDVGRAEGGLSFFCQCME